MKHFLRSCTGSALIEFAAITPVVALLLTGTVEVSRYALLEMKLDKAASSMSDFVTQGASISRGQLSDFANTMPQIMKPFAFDGSVIFSSVSSTTGRSACGNGKYVNCIVWQYRASGSGGSQLGSAGSTTKLPTGYELKNGQDAIVAEVQYQYRPLLDLTGNIIGPLAPHRIYKIAVTKPRRGPLTTLE